LEYNIYFEDILKTNTSEGSTHRVAASTQSKNNFAFFVGKFTDVINKSLGYFIRESNRGITCNFEIPISGIQFVPFIRVL
jgi:hypothetical protein